MRRAFILSLSLLACGANAQPALIATAQIDATGADKSAQTAAPLENGVAGNLAAGLGSGIAWAGGTTALVYFAGMAAEKWLERFSWVALLIAVAVGGIAAILLRERTSRMIAELEAEHARKTGEAATDPV